MALPQARRRLWDRAVTDVLKRGIDELKAGMEGSGLKLPRKIKRGSARVHVMSKHVSDDPDEKRAWLLRRRKRLENSLPKH